MFHAETQVSPSSTEAVNVLRREKKETGKKVLSIDYMSPEESVYETNSDEDEGQGRLLYLPTQIRFLIGGERLTCHWSKLNDALGRTKLNNALRDTTT